MDVPNGIYVYRAGPMVAIVARYRAAADGLQPTDGGLFDRGFGQALPHA
jgi:hypothetical protein